MAKSKEMTLATLDHLITICERCAREGKHLNAESMTVLLRTVRTDVYRRLRSRVPAAANKAGKNE